jgi:hypothetical protein
MSPFVLHKDDGKSLPVYAATAECIERSICHPPCSCSDCAIGFYTAQEQRHPEWSYRRRLSDREAERSLHLVLTVIHDGRAALLRRLENFSERDQEAVGKARPSKARGSPEGSGSRLGGETMAHTAARVLSGEPSRIRKKPGTQAPTSSTLVECRSAEE